MESNTWLCKCKNFVVNIAFTMGYIQSINVYNVLLSFANKNIRNQNCCQQGWFCQTFKINKYHLMFLFLPLPFFLTKEIK